MVLKSTHRGVHSGNTLRASNSRYSRRYHTQGCIVSRVHPQLLQKLLAGGKTEERVGKEVAPKNLAVDVALSLNKQCRWLLPSALVQQVTSNDVAGDLTVSVLQRHKLKRPASCISFHSNKGVIKRIQPRSGRYFCYNYPNADGKSRKAVRRERREVLQQQLQSYKYKNLVGRTVSVFTEQGRSRLSNMLGESEVRYEVYYPCSSNSSISHNPKYIKQDMETAPGDDNNHEFKEHGKAKKKHRAKRRNRMTVKDIDDWDLPQYYTVLANDNLEEEEEKEVVTKTECLKQKITHCLLSSLIEKTERLQQTVVPRRLRRRKKSDSKNVSEDKPRVVYLNQPDTSTPTQDTHTHSEPSPVTQAQVPSLSSKATRVILPVDDVSVLSLRDCFGQNYFEAGCRPRKFMVDMTEHVRELLKKKGVLKHKANTTDDALSYLVFVHDGFYDNEHDVYKVFLNCRQRKGLMAVELSDQGQTDLSYTTVISLISRTLDFMDSFVKGDEPRHLSFDPKAPHRELKQHIGQTEAYIPSLQRLFRMGSGVSEPALPSLDEMLDEEPAFCDVCYDDISPLTLDSAPATALLNCQHRVCDRCWIQHIHSRLQQGFVRVTCPGYDCQHEVNVGVLLSVAAVDTVDMILQRQEEVRIGASPKEKWCPNKTCGRVIHLQMSDSQDFQTDVVCACGAHVCFQCLTPAHWPASCQQASDYRDNILPSASFPDREAEVHDDGRQAVEDKLKRLRESQQQLVVQGKHCPRCKNFVYKDGGCPQMTCRCGQLFCWFCTKPGASHPSRSCITEEKEKERTTTIIVHHLEDKSLETATKEKQAAAAVATNHRRQRVSLIERAAEHRQLHGSSSTNYKAINKIAKAVATAAAKDKNVAQHVLDVCSSHCPSPSSPLPHDQLSLMQRVTRFLQKAVHCKQELHEVSEYSLVLVKDLPDSLLRRRALRITEDLGAFCSFTQSVLDGWTGVTSGMLRQQEAIKALTRLSEIQGWIHTALNTHVATVRKIRSKYV